MLEIHYEIKYQLYDDMKIENLTLISPPNSGLAIEHSISAILWSGTLGTLGGKIDYLWAELIRREGQGGVVHFGLGVHIAMKSLEKAINFRHHMVKVLRTRIRASMLVGARRACFGPCGLLDLASCLLHMTALEG